MFEILLGNTLIATALALAVLVICWIFRPSPATRHALWLIVLIKLLSPIGLIWSHELPFEIPNWLSQTKAPASPADAAPIRMTSTVAMPPPILVESPADVVYLSDFAWVDANVPTPPTELEYTMLRALDPEPPAPIIPPEPTSNPLVVWLPIIWMSGAVFVVWRCARSTMRFARYARKGKAPSPSLQRQVDDLAARLEVKPPVVRVLPDLPSPVIWCLFRRTLLWPKGLQELLSGPGRQSVLVHELAHLRRRDHWARWLEMAAAAIYWWNPLFWLVRRQLRFHAELACDAWVTGLLPEARRSYAEALLEVCARSSRAAAPSPAVGVGGDGRRDFQRRLTMIMRESAPSRLASGARLFVVLMAMAALPAWTLGQAKPETKPTPEGNTIELKEFNILDLDFTPTVGFVDAGTVNDDKIKEIENRLAELNKQLQALKEMKLAGEKGIKVDVIKTKTAPHGEMRIVIAGADGKPIVIDPKTGKVQTDAVPFALEVKEFKIATDSKPNFKIVGPDGQEIKGARIIGPDGKEFKGGVPFTMPLPPLHAYPATPAAKVDSPHAAKEIQAQIEYGLKWLQLAQGKEATIASDLVEAAKKKAEVEAQAARLDAYRAVVATNPTASSIALSRATYKLPKAQSEALAAFLKSHIKAPVLELKVEEGGLTVTTTPETQGTIAGIVKLMQSEEGRKPVLRLELKKE